MGEVRKMLRGVIIDGTGKDVNKIGRQKRLLDQIGYDTYMIFVNTCR